MRLQTVFLCAAALASLGSAAVSQEVRLSLPDGTLSLTGALQSFDGQDYLVATRIGLIRIPARDVVCEGDGCPKPEPESPTTAFEFDISGSDIMIQELVPDFLEHYASLAGAEFSRGGSDEAGWNFTFTRPDSGAVVARISATSEGSTAGIQDLIDGRTVMALSTRPIRDEEAAALVPGGQDELRARNLEMVVATDGLVVVADPSLGVTEISLEDVARVYSGEIRNWSELGGPDRPVAPFARERGSGTRDAFEALVMEPFGREVAARVIGIDNDLGIANAVMAFPGAIGVTSFYNRDTARALAIAEPCGLVAEPDAFSIQTGRYPLTRYLYAYRSPGNATEFSDRLIGYLQSQQGQEALTGLGYVGQRITNEGLEEQKARLAQAMANPPSEAEIPLLRDMIETLISAQRLSPTFRFRERFGEDKLAAENVRRLANELSAGTYDGQEILLVGFTDNTADSPEAAQTESQREADLIRETLLAAAPDLANRPELALSAVGYGALAPLACNGTPQGEAINRRVEVWTRDIRLSR